MRGRSDGGQNRHLVTSLCVMVVFLGLLFLYYGSFFGPGKQHTGTTLESVSKLRSFGWGGDDDGGNSKSDESILGQEGGDDNFMLKSFPVSVFELFVSAHDRK